MRSCAPRFFISGKFTHEYHIPCHTPALQEPAAIETSHRLPVALATALLRPLPPAAPPTPASLPLFALPFRDPYSCAASDATPVPRSPPSRAAALLDSLLRGGSRREVLPTATHVKEEDPVHVREVGDEGQVIEAGAELPGGGGDVRSDGGKSAEEENTDGSSDGGDSAEGKVGVLGVAERLDDYAVSTDSLGHPGPGPPVVPAPSHRRAATVDILRTIIGNAMAAAERGANPQATSAAVAERTFGGLFCLTLPAVTRGDGGGSDAGVASFGPASAAETTAAGLAKADGPVHGRGGSTLHVGDSPDTKVRTDKPKLEPGQAVCSRTRVVAAAV